MAKNHKHLRRLKSEKAKVKLRSKKSINRLPKNLNVTDTSFKVKKILIREQLKHQDETEVLGACKFKIKDLLIRLGHHNSKVREEALKQLKKMLLQQPKKILDSQLNSLLHDVAALSLDIEKDVRKDSLNALNLILGIVSNEQLILFHEVLFSYLNCAMTHINPYVKEDSLYLLDVLIQNCGSVLAKYSPKILSNFLNMICRLHNGIKPGRQLTTTLNSKTTSIKSRIKVLERLANLFASIVNYKKLDATKQLNVFSMATKTKKHTKYIPVYGDSTDLVCKINFDKHPNSTVDYIEGILPMAEFIKYVAILMPLMFDIWLEACPDEKLEDYTETTISNETCMLLKNIVEIIQLIIEYIDILDHNKCDTKRTKYWFRDSFHNLYMKNLLSRFPYAKAKQSINEPKKHQDLSQMEFTGDCLEQNFVLCRIHIWFTSVSDDKQLPKSTKDYCISIMKYLNGKLENWCISDSSVLSHLTKLLRTLFLKASPVWYANHINLSDTLQLIVEASFSSSRKELQSHLSLIIGDILLECDLNELHREKALKKFVTTLPSLLLRPSIDDIAIRMICRIVLRFKELIQEELVAKHEAIIENVKEIDITGSCDDKQSRLMICNLFYFMNAQIYY